MKLSQLTIAAILAATADFHVAASPHQIEKRVSPEPPPAPISLNHENPISFNEADGLDTNTRIAGGAYVSELPYVVDIEEPDPETGTGGIAAYYYRRMFSRQSNPGSVGISSSNTATLEDCYLLRYRTAEDGGYSDDPNKFRYIEELGEVFVKSESFGPAAAFDPNQMFVGVECEAKNLVTGVSKGKK